MATDFSPVTSHVCSLNMTHVRKYKHKYTVYISIRQHKYTELAIA